MKINLKQIAATLIGLFALVGAGYTFDKRYITHKVTELMIADVQTNQMMIQEKAGHDRKQMELDNVKEWYDWYNSEIERMTRECATDPNNQDKKAYLESLKRRRDNAKAAWDRLMQEE